MLFSLLLLAIFSSTLPFEAESTYLFPQCDEKVIQIIYGYWKATTGIPTLITERDVKCHEREILIVSTPGLYNESVTCSVIRHYANHQETYQMAGSELFNSAEDGFFEYRGKIIMTSTSIVRYQVHDRNDVRLLYICTNDWNAPKGENQFFIRGGEKTWTSEGVEHMKKLMCELFNVDEEKLRTYSTSCPIPGEPPVLDCSVECEHCTKRW